MVELCGGCVNFDLGIWVHGNGGNRGAKGPSIRAPLALLWWCSRRDLHCHHFVGGGKSWSTAFEFIGNFGTAIWFTRS